MNYEELTFEINGRQHNALVQKGARLLDALRELGYTGTKEGCGEGECGACTVLLDGRPVNSCIVFAKQAHGHKLQTVEGLGAGHPDGLHPFQKALIEVGGVQCGFCTPGFVVTGCHHLDTGGSLEEGAVREALSGNLCRCTGYTKVVEAVKKAGKAKTEALP